MDKSVPKGAALILDFIAGFESRGRYDIVFGDHKIPKPITSMTVSQLIAAQRIWGRQWGSSAAGRYQIVRTTLEGLKKALKLSGEELFTPDLQDRLGYELLRQRGYPSFVTKKIGATVFGKKLAQEFASMPVLAATQGAHRKVGRGETYYAGDRLNRALVPPDKVEALLAKVLASA